MTRSLNTTQQITITSEKDFAELKKNYGESAVKEICKSIQVFDHQAQADLEFFWSIKNAIEAAKDNFLENEGEDARPAQVNVDVFVVKKDEEEFSFFFVEFMKESGSYRHGATYASDEDAEAIFDGKESIDTTFLFDNEYESEEI